MLVKVLDVDQKKKISKKKGMKLAVEKDTLPTGNANRKDSELVKSSTQGIWNKKTSQISIF